MGLGPALCLTDQVLGEHVQDENNQWYWRCPVCYTTKLGSTGIMFERAQMKQWADNLKFWKFVDGKDPTV